MSIAADMDDRVVMIEAGLLSLDLLVTEALPFTAGAELDAATGIYDRLQQVARDTGRIRDELANRIGEAMPEYKLLLAGKVRVRLYRRSRRNWKSEDLLRLVIDSRVVDETTGEIESTLDILKQVYPLAGYNARLNELKRLGINADEFCETEVRGYKLGDAYK